VLLEDDIVKDFESMNEEELIKFISSANKVLESKLTKNQVDEKNEIKNIVEKYKLLQEQLSSLTVTVNKIINVDLKITRKRFLNQHLDNFLESNYDDNNYDSVFSDCFKLEICNSKDLDDCILKVINDELDFIEIEDFLLTQIVPAKNVSNFLKLLNQIIKEMKKHNISLSNLRKII